MRNRLPLIIDMNEYNFINADDRLQGEFVSYETSDRYRTVAKLHGFHANFNDITQLSRAYKVDLGHEFGGNISLAQLACYIDCSFLINPRQNGASKKSSMGVEIGWFDQFPAKKSHFLHDTIWIKIEVV